MTLNVNNKKTEHTIVNTSVTQNDCIECFQDTLTQHGMGELKVTQVSKGSYSDSHHILAFPRLTLNSQQLNSNIIKCGCFSKKKYSIMLPDVDAALWINGKKTTENSLYIVAPNEILCTHNINPYSTYTILVDENELGKYLEFNSLEQVQHNSENIRIGKTWLPHLEHMRADLKFYLFHLFKNIDTLNFQSKLDAEEYIFESLEKLLTIPMKYNINNPSFNSRLKIVNRALEYIYSTNIIGIYVVNLTAVAFCSLRTLEYAFKSILGVTPKQFLMLRRMHLIKSAIKSHESLDLKSILDLYGIVNISRFNQDFYQLFGVYPFNLLK